MKRLLFFLLILPGIVACVKEVTPETLLTESPGPVTVKTN